MWGPDSGGAREARRAGFSPYLRQRETSCGKPTTSPNPAARPPTNRAANEPAKIPWADARLPAMRRRYSGRPLRDLDDARVRLATVGSIIEMVRFPESRRNSTMPTYATTPNSAERPRDAQLEQHSAPPRGRSSATRTLRPAGGRLKHFLDDPCTLSPLADCRGMSARARPEQHQPSSVRRRTSIAAACHGGSPPSAPTAGAPRGPGGGRASTDRHGDRLWGP